MIEGSRDASDGAGDAPLGDVLKTIQASVHLLSPAHRQIAEMILADPQWSVQSSVDELAARAGVAKPTIVRFARAVGCDGLKDLKLRLAGALALGGGHLHRAVRAGDSPTEVVGKVVGAAMSAMSQWRQLLDVGVLQQAAEVLHDARRVDCFSSGTTSAFIATDFQARLFRLGLTATAYSDAYHQLIAAAMATPRDVVVAISFVGVMPHLLDAVMTARRQGACVIALTRRGSPMSELADIVLPTDAPPDITMPVGVDAYLTQLMMIEILSVLVGRIEGPDYDRRLESVYKLLHSRQDGAWPLEKGD